MTCTNKQVGILMKENKRHTQKVAAAKAGMTPKTARKYLTKKQPPKPLENETRGRPRRSVFDEYWPEIMALLNNAPGLEAKTILEWMIEKDAEKYSWDQLRTLQRRIREWRATQGPDSDIIFIQKLVPGRQSQSDCTYMNELNITIAGEPYPHLLFHFILPYSRWETVSICFSESFDSLSNGFETAVWELGGVTPEHRTDNLTAATHAFGNGREFNERWEDCLGHYGVKPSRNNPGVSHENGSIEKSHDLFKKAVNQQLLMRGTRDFSSVVDYELFLNQIKDNRNKGKKQRLMEELAKLLPLPERRWDAPQIVPVRVSPCSTIQVLRGTYSVPSRLIGHALESYVYPSKIVVYYGNHQIQTMPRLPKEGGKAINYRHVVKHLLRKPGAFENYQYRECLFPRLVFRKAYDALKIHSARQGHKYYLEVLHLAAIGNEGDVAIALELLLESGEIPLPDTVKTLLKAPGYIVPPVKIQDPNLAQYDTLLQHMEASHATVH